MPLLRYAATGGDRRAWLFFIPADHVPGLWVLQEKRLGVGLYTLSYYDKTGKAWTSFQYRGAPTKDPSRNASES